MKKIIYALLAIFVVYQVNSANLMIFDVDKSQFPTMKAKFFAFDNNNVQITNISPGDFLLKENGTERTIIDITCNTNYEPVPVSSVMVTDISGSMWGDRLEAAKEALRIWVRNVFPGNSEVALTTFNFTNQLVQDFTQDSTLLEERINAISCNGGTSFDAALINPEYGGMIIAERGTKKRIVVLLTDGSASLTKIDSVIERAERNNIQIFCVTIQMRCPDQLRIVCESSGGAWFENVNNQTEIIGIYQTILNMALNKDACEITWESELNCDSTDINVTVESEPFDFNADFVYNPGIVSGLYFSPKSVFFKDKPIGVKADTIITITAKNNFVISDITSSNPEFEITPKNFIIQNGETKQLHISFTPTAETYSWSKFELINNLCPVFCSASGGHRDSKPVKTLKIDFPNGNEKLIAGTDTLIKWSGVAPSAILKLEYSTNSGSSWNTLTNKATNGEYLWEGIPKSISDYCLARAFQIDESKADEANCIFKYNGHTNAVTKAVISNDGSKIASISKDNTLKIINSYSMEEEADINITLNEITNVVWSASDDKIIFTTQSMLYVYNLITESLFYSYNIANSIFSLDYNPKTSKIAVGSYNTILLFSPEIQTPLKTFTAGGGQISTIKLSDDDKHFIASSGRNAFRITIADGRNTPIGTNLADIINIAYSPKEQYITVTDIAGNTKIYITSTLGQLQEINGLAQQINGNPINPDETLFAAGSMNGSLQVWDIKTGNIYRNFVGHNEQVNRLQWSNSGKYIASCSNDSTGKIWELSANEPKYSLIGHSDAVNYIQWSNDDALLVTAGSDNNVILWNFQEQFLQADTSDNKWAIVSPNPQTQEINLKMAVVGSIKDTIINDYVSNMSSYPGKITSIYFEGTDAIYFDYVSNLPPIDLPANGTVTGEFRFLPNRVGNIQATFVIVTTTDTIKALIKGQGIKGNLKSLLAKIDFGKVELGKEKSILDTAVFTNIGTSPIPITSIALAFPVSDEYELISSKEPFVIAPGDTIRASIKYKPLRKGYSNTGLTYEYLEDGSPSIIPVLGQCVNSGPAVKYYLPDLVPIICQSNEKFKIILKNTGGRPLVINSIDISGLNADCFELNSLQSFSIEPDSSEEIILLFIPNSVGTKNAKLIIKNNSENASTLEVPFSYIKESAEFSTDLSDINIGAMRPSKPWSGSIRLKNIGSLSNKYDISVSGSFTLSENISRLTPNEEKEITINFPGQFAAGDINEQITLTDSICGIELVIPIYGKITSGAAIQSEMPLPVNLLCDDSKIDSIKITNAGNQDLIISNAYFEDTQYFKLISNLTNKTIIPDEEVYLVYSFTSAQPANHQTVLHVISNSAEYSDYQLNFTATKELIDLSSASNTIDLKYVCPNSNLEKTLALKNNGNSFNTFQINKSNLIDIEEYKISLYPKEEIELKYLISTQADGSILNEYITFTDTICGKDFSFNIIGEAVTPSASIDNIVITSVVSNQNSANLIIKNISKMPLTISTKPDVALPFEIEADFPRIIDGFKEDTLLIKYSPDNLSNSNETLTIYFEECNYSQDIIINGIAKAADLTLSIDTIEAKTGEDIIVKIKFENPNKVEFSDNAELSFDLSYNSTVISTTKYQQSISNGYATIKVNSPIQGGLENQLSDEIPFSCGLGNADSTVISILNPQISNSAFSIVTNNGLVRITNICQEGGKRLVNPNSKISINSVSTNKITNKLNVEYSLAEAGNYHLYLTNILGQTFYLENNSKSSIGSSNKEYDISNLPAGIYYLVLETRSEVKSKLIQVIE